MKLHEELELQANQKQAQQLKEAASKSTNDAELLASQAKWAQIRIDLQPLLDQAKAEYESNLELIHETAEEAISYINPKLEELRQQLVQKFPIVIVTSSSLQIDGLANPHMRGQIVKPEGPKLEDFKDHITPATHLWGHLSAAMV